MDLVTDEVTYLESDIGVCIHNDVTQRIEKIRRTTSTSLGDQEKAMNGKSISDKFSKFRRHSLSITYWLLNAGRQWHDSFNHPTSLHPSCMMIAAVLFVGTLFLTLTIGSVASVLLGRKTPSVEVS